jgi:superfamily II DNA/RNA helicase
VDAFEVHRRLIADYRAFTEGFISPREPRVAQVVSEESARGAQWPDPWLSLNPSFAPGGRISALTSSGLLHPECERIFRVKASASDPGTSDLLLHQHQRDAIEIAASKASYVLTTGTGSGKSLAYIIPIVDRVLRNGTGKGVQAIVVYPMNALANSQVEELKKFLEYGYGGQPPVTFKRYTGQEKQAERAQILANPPDILLTNYVMLELILTRPDERAALIKAAQGLQFLVLDELHTYRGRQGADVGMLVRRVREACDAHDTLQCIGTSATMSSGGTTLDQQRDVAEVATRIFGTDVRPEHVITETLVRATSDRSPSADALTRAIRARGPAEAIDPVLAAGYEALTHDPLASWIEDTFGVTEEHETGLLIRRAPTTVTRAAVELADLTGTDAALAASAIRATLLAGSRAKAGAPPRSLFAFRLHQFVSKGGSVYVTAEPVGSRAIETDYQVVLPGEPERRLYPLAFCRECGQEYLMVTRNETIDGSTVIARHELRIQGEGDGYLFVSDDSEWPHDPLPAGRLPASWLEDTATGPRVRQSRRKDVPVRVHVDIDGTIRDANADTGAAAAFIPGQLRFCLHCGVSYESQRQAELAKVATLDTEGRSSAMTVIASSIVRTLKAMPQDQIPEDARKLLTFVDNRQDASLQAGHLNDFVQVVRLRGAVYQAALDSDTEFGLETVDLASAIARNIALEPSDYAQAPDALDLRNAQRALRGVLEYRALMDLRKGWRVTLPNLEQCGLIVVDYPFARTLAERADQWATAHPLLQLMDPEQREEVIRVLLDEFRRNLALEADALSSESFERLRRLSRDNLSGLWALPIGEPDPDPGLMILGPRGKDPSPSLVSLTGRGAFGLWLKRTLADPLLKSTDIDDVLASLIEVLVRHGMLVKATSHGMSGYRLNASALSLRPGQGDHGAPDPVRRSFEAEAAPRVVPYFRDLYRDAAAAVGSLHAAEHTAQVSSQDRQEREDEFREGRLPLLFCSPTMELGVDIASLNAVAMRNVPPTPANYAQRSGRAGRSGQQAIVVTYCASGNAHDSYYFARSHLMVAGQVQPPRLDLTNADLVRSHIHAVWLAEALTATQEGLGRSLAQVLDLTQPGLPVADHLTDILRDEGAARRATATASRILDPLAAELEQAAWWSDTWIDDVIRDAPQQFDAACQRWRDLYTLAAVEKNAAHALNSDPTASPKEREDARRRYAEASRRVELLLNETDSDGQSDFYTYRYLASEGFLPGYSFPRLPLAAYIPGNRGRDSSWLQRARFLAIREFGPGALIYHEGSRYQVTRIALPRGGEGESAGQVIRTEASICTSCGYHHPRQAGTDVCESCGDPLAVTWSNMLQLQQVITRPRRRISADEEERNRVGYELRTTYRFPTRPGPHGPIAGRLDAAAVSSSGTPVAEVSYGDAAEIRVVNLGRRGRANKDLLGFNLDLIKGRWLPDKGEQTAEGDEYEADLEDVKTRDRVLPYVEDRRNIAVLRWSNEVSDDEAVTLQYAIERGLEAAFQLEDSELASELLPDNAARGRVLLIESAEGGAGVLRRLHGDPDALARAAHEALRIMHVDPTTGREDDDACVRGCYRCLLTYGNQTDHEHIDRRLAVPTLRTLAVSTTRPLAEQPPTVSAVDPGSVLTRADDVDLSPPSRALLDLLVELGLSLPDLMGEQIDGIRVELAWPDRHAAVLHDGDTSTADSVALVMNGWNVLRVSDDTDLRALVDANPSIFGARV